MLRLGLLICILWWIPGLGAWAGAPERTFQNCEEIITVAEPLMPEDAFAQLLALTEDQCMAVFGDFTPVELSHLLSDTTVHISVEDGYLVQTRNPRLPGTADAIVAAPIPPWRSVFLQAWDRLVQVKETVLSCLDNLSHRLMPE